MNEVTYRVCYSYADQFGRERVETGPHYRERVNAELWAATMFISIKPDWVTDHEREFDCYVDGGPETCEWVGLYVDGELVASLGCVDDADDDCRRVVEGELALEYVQGVLES